MLASITPLGERSRRSRWGVTVGALAVGAMLGGALLGAAAGAAGKALALRSAAPSARLGALLAAALLGALLDLVLRGSRLPGTARQVNEDWLGRYRGWVYGAGFGWQLGVGVATVVTASAVYLVFLAALLSASAAAGAALGGTFGLARGLTSLATARVLSPAQLLALGDRLTRWERPARLLAPAAQCLLVLVALTALVS